MVGKQAGRTHPPTAPGPAPQRESPRWKRGEGRPCPLPSPSPQRRPLGRGPAARESRLSGGRQGARGRTGRGGDREGPAKGRPPGARLPGGGDSPNSLRRRAEPGPSPPPSAPPPAPLLPPPPSSFSQDMVSAGPRATSRLPEAGAEGWRAGAEAGGGVTVGEGGKRMGDRPRALRDPNGGGEGPRSQINPTESSTTSRPDPVSRRPVIGLTPPAVQPMGGRLFPGAGGGPRRGDVTPAPGADCKARTGTAGGDCGPSAPCGVARVARRPSPLRQTPQAY